MTESEKEQDSLWRWFEKGIIFVFLFVTLAAFAFNFTKYAWQHDGFELYNDFIWWLFNIKVAWGFMGLAVSFAFLLAPLSFISFILLIISITIPKWFKERFRVKYWYGLFVIQILTWILIYNI